MRSRSARAKRALRRVKTVHTLAWLVFASAILAIPIATALTALTWAMWLSLFVWGEVFVLVLNRMRCPLTAVAERYTEDRAGNFDIFLPEWLARNNQLIFGSAFLLDELFLLLRWTAG